MWVVEKVLTGTLKLLSLEPWLEGSRLQAALPRLLQKELDQAFPLLLVQVVNHLVLWMWRCTCCWHVMLNGRSCWRRRGGGWCRCPVALLLSTRTPTEKS